MVKQRAASSLAHVFSRASDRYRAPFVSIIHEMERSCRLLDSRRITNSMYDLIVAPEFDGVFGELADAVFPVSENVHLLLSGCVKRRQTHQLPPKS